MDAVLGALQRRFAPDDDVEAFILRTLDEPGFRERCNGVLRREAVPYGGGMGVAVPYQSLAPAVLRRLVEEFVSREATDYGYEVSFDRKVEEVLRQLQCGEAVVLFDERSQTTTIAPTEAR